MDDTLNPYLGKYRQWIFHYAFIYLFISLFIFIYTMPYHVKLITELVCVTLYLFLLFKMCASKITIPVLYLIRLAYPCLVNTKYGQKPA